MADIVWNIAALECINKHGKDGVVSTVHWRCKGSDGTNTASVYGSIGVPYEGGPFTQYDALTKDTVVGWVKAQMGADEVVKHESSVAAQLAELAAPAVTKPPLPW
jgi:hypothetical protein